jgi:hypothetical protein
MEKKVWLMVNAVFGKTMETLRKRIHVEIVIEDQKRVEKLIASPYFAAADVIQPENMVVVKLNIKYWLIARFQSNHNAPVNTPASMESRTSTPTIGT